ncbi:hypothetical protein CHELA1G11_12409 [Hyphomicrobiales bacterium]|nr:hypothetical protein CHELA1G2_11900 [Hyphomicrobiales bacterium]CAH1664639.1 hypothetical protein CHELA1G11_12409 [Hyphomicrobiales bacterium]
MTHQAHRSPTHPIHQVFLDRWSPRAFTDAEIPLETLKVILEAARWAPSAFNAQPWRFLYARRGDANWETFLGSLNAFNRSWAAHAGALVFVVSRATMRPPGGEEDVPSYSHSFDAGAAWGFLALQATLLGWHSHAMTGFDHENAPNNLGVLMATASRLPSRSANAAMRRRCLRGLHRARSQATACLWKRWRLLAASRPVRAAKHRGAANPAAPLGPRLRSLKFRRNEAENQGRLRALRAA